MTVSNACHHVFAAPPQSGPLARALARTLAHHQAEVAALAAPRPAPCLHVEDLLPGRGIAGLEGFFPEARARAEGYRARLHGPVARLVLSVLPLDLYLPMLWRAQALRRLMPGFDTMAPALTTCRRGWADVVADLVTALAPAETVVIPAPVDAAVALAQLMPGLSLPLPMLTATETPDTALAMLQRLYRQGVVVPPRQIARLSTYHARLPQPAPLAAFGADEAACLRTRFAADLDRIAALPGVRICGRTVQHLAAQ